MIALIVALIALGLSLLVNGALGILLVAAWREHLELQQRVQKYDALCEVAIGELQKVERRFRADDSRHRDGMRNLLSDLLKDWPADPQVH